MFFRKNKTEEEIRSCDAPKISEEVAALLDSITVNEQSSIRIGREKVIYFDPFRLPEAPHDADVIFITHAHYDHFSPEDIDRIRKSDTVFLIPASMKSDLSKLGANGSRVVALVPGESKEVCGIPVETVPAYNRTKPFHPKKNGWLGYIITVGGVRIYVAGDTDATEETQGVKCGVALLPIGGTYTMNAKEARELALKLAPSAVIPTHYGTVVGSFSDYDSFAKGLPFAVKKIDH